MALADRTNEVGRDTFDSSIDSNWTNPDATSTGLTWVTGGYVEHASLNTDTDMGRNVGTYDTSEQWSTVVVQTHSGTGNNFISATCQNQGTTCYLGTIETTGTDEARTQIYDPFSTLGNSAFGPANSGDTVTLEVRINGSSRDLEVFSDNSGTDTSIQGPDTTATVYTGGRPGVFSRAAAVNRARITEWYGGDFTSTGTTEDVANGTLTLTGIAPGYTRNIFERVPSAGV